MGEKRKKIYQALIDGATEGLTGKSLDGYVADRCAEVSSKKLVRAALLALTDPHVTDRNILSTVYALAIKHRMNEISAEDGYDKRQPQTASKATRKSTKVQAPVAVSP